MSYVLCSVQDCTHHDGEGCTLETVEIFKPLLRMTYQEKLKTRSRLVTTPIIPDIAACRDYKPLIPHL